MRREHKGTQVDEDTIVRWLTDSESDDGREDDKGERSINHDPKVDSVRIAKGPDLTRTERK